ncbi:MAG: HYR domain-containing protein [Bacteroidales bacterium]|nr:HYR domain-containing protein [Bacteroidales bacterium]
MIFPPFLLMAFSYCHCQTINIHSISTARQTSEGDGGYTLDGGHMAASRFKLLNTSNFGETGTYNKNISIYDYYFTSGSLKQITQVEGIDIFFFGSFNNSSATFKKFTSDEIDSLYKWSKNGGKMLIAEQGDIDGVFENIGYKWGYHIQNYSTSSIIPNEQGLKTKIFNGPFGEIQRASQGGFAQGYFVGLPKNISVLATDGGGRATLYIDCSTMDLICADTDAFTDLGGLSISQDIENNQDIFWANIIAFMDSLGEAPKADIYYDGTTISTGEFDTYSWFNNWSILNGENSSSIVPQEDGYYRVVVQDKLGCIDTSDVITIGSITGPVINCPKDTIAYTDFRENYAILELPSPDVLDVYEIVSISSNASDTFFVGETIVEWTAINSEGYSTTCSQKVSVLDNEAPVINCPEDYYSPAIKGEDYAIIHLEEPDVRDNVFVDSISYLSPDTFKIGTSFVYWTAFDSSGNRSECNQSISVVDYEPPAINCPDDVYDSLPVGMFYSEIILDTPDVYDNHSILSITNNSPDSFLIGTTYVTWTVIDSSGNSAECEQIVVIEESSLRIPNIITPNGDGLNDCLVIDGLPENSELVIFNDKNQILFKTGNYQNDWNGTDNNGNSIDNGTYWYVLTISSSKYTSGFIIIKRE